MPSRHNQGRQNNQKDPEDEAPEGANSLAQKSNKRDSEDDPVHSAVAISPEAKQGSIVAYMASSPHPATPRRGVGKKKTRAIEDMMEELEDDEIQNTFDAIRRADAAAKQTLRDIEKERNDQATTKDTTNHSERNKLPTQDNENEEATSTSTGKRNSETGPNKNTTNREEPTNGKDSSTQLSEGPDTTDLNTQPKETQRDEAKTDKPQQNKVTEDKEQTKPGNKTNKRKKKPPKNKRKQKQSHILEAGPNGKAQLAGSPQTSDKVEDDTDKKDEVVKDKAYYDKIVADRTREFNFRINFTLLLTDSTGTLEEKKAKALTQLKEEVKTFQLLDPMVAKFPHHRTPT